MLRRALPRQCRLTESRLTLREVGLGEPRGNACHPRKIKDAARTPNCIGQRLALREANALKLLRLELGDGGLWTS